MGILLISFNKSSSSIHSKRSICGILLYLSSICWCICTFGIVLSNFIPISEKKQFMTS